MAENKNYNFDNFDDTKIYGKHFKDDEVPPAVFSSEFDVDDVSDTQTADDISISSFSTPENKTDDYGDDFYSDATGFENDDIDQTRVFDPADDYEMKNYREVKDNKKEDNKKNVAIIALTITLAVVIFVFSLIFFISASDKDKKKDETKPTDATETVAVTQQEEEETQYVEPTVAEYEDEEEDETPEPTQYIPEVEPTQAPEPEPIQTEPPVVEEESVYVEIETEAQFEEVFE